MTIESLLSKLPFGPWRNLGPIVSVVRLDGVIGNVGPLRRGLTLAHVAPLLERAFAPKGQAAVALVVNSPGGSPVQSSLIGKRIRDLAAEKKVPVLAFCEDVAASGGYWLACAADEIFADESSIVGSIGVVYSSFGLHDFIQRHGVERRVHTAGDRKMLLDPFSPEREDGVAHLKSIQAEIHDSFKAMVRARRGDRLTGPEEELFSGAFWAGRRALEHGLVDGIGDLRGILRARYGEKVRLRVVGEPQGWLRRRLHMGARGGWAAELADAALSSVEERALWGRYGL
ncbi:MAG TPA: S49 family peptidase [Azospirillum sp.]